jgi:hypothetical protein
MSLGGVTIMAVEDGLLLSFVVASVDVRDGLGGVTLLSVHAADDADGTLRLTRRTSFPSARRYISPFVDDSPDALPKDSLLLYRRMTFFPSGRMTISPSL